jgi:hypothetical protein
MLYARILLQQAVSHYRTLAPRNARGEAILNDSTRQEVCDMLHQKYPGWHNLPHEHFSLDEVERRVFHNT